MPDFLQDKIKSSEEYKAMVRPANETEVPDEENEHWEQGKQPPESVANQDDSQDLPF